MLKTAHGWEGVDQILGVNMIFNHFRNALVRICTCSYIHRSYARRFYKFKCWGRAGVAGNLGQEMLFNLYNT